MNPFLVHRFCFEVLTALALDALEQRLERERRRVRAWFQ
jgi:hypothetical protein